jgi:Protein of unknown function (DUF3426)
VLPEQLAARNGQVRCGKCDTVFDGVAGLLKDSRAPARAEPPAQPEGIEQAAAEPPLPEFLAERPPPRRGPWRILAALAASALLAQAALYYRAEIAAGLPMTRDALEDACRVLGCEMRLPRQVKLLSIDSYDVRPDPRREGVIVLSAVIRNRAPFAQEYPALQLTLTDETNRDLVSRSILPQEYLEAGRARELMARGIDAGGEAALTLHLDAGRTRATGYELVLFYPS